MASSSSASSSARSRRTAPWFGRAQRRRQRAHQHGAGAEGFDLQAEPGELIGARQQPGGIRGRQVHNRRQQQGLRAHAAIQHLLTQCLMGKALMRGMLIDQDQVPSAATAII